MFKCLIFCAPLAVISSVAMAAVDTQTEMTARYGDVQNCMEHTLGKQWEQRYGIKLTVNRWGAVEATGSSIDSAPEAVRLTDLRCRRQLSLAGQPRP